MPANPKFTDRHLEAADEIKDILADQLPPAAHVARVYAPDQEFRTFTGRWLWVIPTVSPDVARLARRRMLTEYGFSIVYTRRYEDPASASHDGPVPNSWVDEECGWVNENVYTFLNDRVRQDVRLLDSLWPETCTLAVKFDPAELAQKVLWSLVEVAYREGRRG